jgi:hypothetical protein
MNMVRLDVDLFQFVEAGNGLFVSREQIIKYQKLI